MATNGGNSHYKLSMKKTKTYCLYIHSLLYKCTTYRATAWKRGQLPFISGWYRYLTMCCPVTALGNFEHINTLPPAPCWAILIMLHSYHQLKYKQKLVLLLKQQIASIMNISDETRPSKRINSITIIPCSKTPGGLHDCMTVESQYLFHIPNHWTGQSVYAMIGHERLPCIDPNQMTRVGGNREPQNIPISRHTTSES